MKTYRTTILLLFAAVCPAAAQTDTTPVLAYLARVRIVVPQWIALSEELGTKWHTGMVVGGGAHCIMVSPDSVTMRDLDRTIPQSTRLPQLGVPFDMIARIQVSSFYDGRYVQGQPARVYERGADVTEEQWIELSVDSVMRDPSSCPGETRNEQSLTPVSDHPTSWDVFDLRGVWLGSVELPARFVVMEIGADYAAGVWKDDTDVEYVRVYELVKINQGERRS